MRGRQVTAAPNKVGRVLSYLMNTQGTEGYHRHALGMLYTDGVEFVADTVGAHWLVDIVASWQPEVRKADPRGGAFQAWTLHDTGDGWIVTCTDGDDLELARQEIPATDFPPALSPFRLWVEHGVILLPEEH